MAYRTISERLAILRAKTEAAKARREGRKPRPIPTPTFTSLDLAKAYLRNHFPIGCRVKWNKAALSSHRRRLGQQNGCVTGYTLRRECGGIPADWLVAVKWDGEQITGASHPHWIEIANS